MTYEHVTNTHIEGMLDDLLSLESGLTVWECKFIDSIKSYWDLRRRLSHRQLNTLIRLYDKLVLGKRR